MPAWATVPPLPAASSPRVVFAGRLEHEKGVEVLIEATRGLDCEVVIAGRGTQDQRLRRRAHARTRFVGHLPQPDLAALLRSAAVAVVPSLYEPFGLAALEAMAAGVPVIATSVGGLVDVVVPGSGLLVPPDDPLELAAAIRRISVQPDLARDLVAGGAARARQLSWHASAAAHVELYTAMTRRQRG